MIGKVISNYKIIEKIDEGGMGQVFLAEDIELNRKAALKFLLPQFVSDEKMKARFMNEARTVAQLNHPNIVTIYQVSEYEDKVYIAMEYVEGQSLDEVIKNNTMTLDQVFDLGIQICDGLNEAHKAEIVHRDIKPRNIRIQKNGHIKILDFGLAKLKEGSKKTSQSTTLGTLAYMAPEQIGSTNVDHRADIFAFGVLMYEMITGQLPFAGDYEAAIIYAILNEQPEPLARYKKDISDRLQYIIEKSLEKDPQDRYQHIDEIQTDLRSEKNIIQNGRHMKASEGRRLAAIMFIDIVGYSRMMGKDEDETLILLQDYEKIVSPIINANHGIIIKKLGDGLFCEFSSALEAVDCAIKMHKELHQFNQNQANDFKLITRVGIHIGDVIKKKNDLYGDGVNIAARIEPLAPKGGICISEAIYSVIKNHPRFEIVSLGMKELKNIDQKYHLYQIKTGYEVETESIEEIDDTEQTAEKKHSFKNIIKNKISIILVSVIVIISVTATVLNLYDFKNEEISPNKTDTKIVDSESSKIDKIPENIKEQINSKKSVDFISQIKQLKNFGELSNYLQNNQNMRKLLFGNKRDFSSPNGKFIIIADENNIYTLLYYFDLKYYDLFENQAYQSLSEQFRGKRAIWVEIF